MTKEDPSTRSKACPSSTVHTKRKKDPYGLPWDRTHLIVMPRKKQCVLFCISCTYQWHLSFFPIGYSSSGASPTGYGYHTSEKSDKGMVLKDLFELALTALAFKSFGLFILNVVMCIYAGVSNAQVISRPFKVRFFGQAVPKSNRAPFYKMWTLQSVKV